MKVKELIAYLKIYNPDAKVMVAINDTDSCNLEVIVEDSEDVVCLIGATDDF